MDESKKAGLHHNEAQPFFGKIIEIHTYRTKNNHHFVIQDVY